MSENGKISQSPTVQGGVHRSLISVYCYKRLKEQEKYTLKKLEKESLCIFSLKMTPNDW